MGSDTSNSYVHDTDDLSCKFGNKRVSYDCKAFNVKSACSNNARFTLFID